VIDQENVCFNDLAKIYEDKKFKTNNTATVCLLVHRETGRKMIVSSSHLHWNPKLEYVRMAQAHYLLFKISKFAEKYSQGAEKDIPVILGGDFNSHPDSGVLDIILGQKEETNNDLSPRSQ